MVVRCELKIPSLGITVRHHEAMPNSYHSRGDAEQLPVTRRCRTVTLEFSIRISQSLIILIYYWHKVKPILKVWYISHSFNQGNLFCFIRTYEPRQANLCLRAFRHDKFQQRMPSHSEGPGIWLSV